MKNISVRMNISGSFESVFVIVRPQILFHLVNSSHHGAVGSASAWQTRGGGFEPVLMRYIFSGKYHGT